jgi:hypothetical protein
MGYCPFPSRNCVKSDFRLAGTEFNILSYRAIYTILRYQEYIFIIFNMNNTHRWEDNIKMDLQQIGCEGVNWIQLIQDRVQLRDFMKTVMNLRVP